MAKDLASSFDRIIYLFQGGGALGAYQVGVFKALHENGYLPDWMIGTSIGAINSAIVAGNKPEKRIEKLEGFWNSISTKLPAMPDTLNNIVMERWHHFVSAQMTAWFGQPGFFRPRWWNPWWSLQSTVDKLSYYDTSELRETLLRYVDFDLINQKKVRLSIGSVRVATGELVYFDNTKIEITPEHVMASGALPPGFPAVCIDNAMYWDGGVHSNTQVNLLFKEDEPIRSLCFMVHLFDSYGTRPITMDGIYKRQKDISYSSHHHQFITAYGMVQNLRHAIRVLSENMPEEKLNSAELKELIELGHSGVIHLARFHYKGKLSDLSSKDYEFSLSSVMEHIKNGCEDAARTLRKPPWEEVLPEDIGLVVYELSDDPATDHQI
ncbi:patatin-like phospholipase family protein [Aquicella lusitana]|uniref:NTE family protein n=1 Tax=Aquicella lusitana TaxID=254246 RepID=A0A370GIZ3_9COXI|nr:patatin-like phospholipase family protein [Aquicella lusitana]RDI43772.1 NTE family protein [Aquicella lusitana]VVC74497.1 hypothetical protein AQULUS_22630 [Aquicella lusitana]